MKKILFVVWACYVYTSTITAQDFTYDLDVPQNVEAQIESALSSLDMSPVTSGILQGRTLTMGSPDLWGSGDASDSIYCHMTQLSIQYEGMYAARLPSNTSLANTDQAYQNARDAYIEGSIVPVRLMAMRYHRFYKDAVNTGKLLKVFNKLYHGSGYRTADAYEERRVYHSGFFTNQWLMHTDLQIDAASLIGNLNIAANSIYIDADDGLGFRPVTLGTLFSINYAQTGDYLVKIKYRDIDNNEVYHYHNVEVVSTYSSMTKGLSADTRGLPLDIECSQNASYCETIVIGEDSIHVSTLLSCGGDAADLMKPFVILDGIDLTWDQNRTDFRSLLNSRTQGLNYEESSLFNSLSLGDILQASGYDIIFIDYFDHHIRIQDNAALVAEALREIQTQLDANGSDEAIRMMGISMGGLVGKYALLEMENNGETHNVDKYFTFDSPMQGANVPICVQSALFHASKIKIPFGGFIAEMEFGESIEFSMNVLGSPAARQMTRHNIFNNLTPWTEDMNYDFFKELDEMGELSQCETVAISNGSDMGAGGQIMKLDSTNLSAGDLIFSVDDDELSVVGNETQLIIGGVEVGLTAVESLLSLIPTVGILFKVSSILSVVSDNVEMDIEAYAAGGPSGTKIYDGTLEASILFGIVDLLPNLDVKNTSNTLAMDGAPGGKIGNSLFPLLNTVEGLVNSGLTITVPDLSFIPTVSALDIQGADTNGDYMHDNLLVPTGGSINTSYARFVAEDEQIIGVAPAPSLVNNHAHVTLTRDNVTLLVGELIGSADLNIEPTSTLSSIFNYGDSGLETQLIGNAQVFGQTSTILPNDYTIVDGGAIFVNDEQRIRYVSDPANPYNQNGSSFTVDVLNVDCNATPGVIFESGGLLEIGDYSASNIGDLIINDETSVTFEKESIAIINNDSRIIVRDGGILRLELGADISLLQNSQIIIEQGGRLIIEEGADIFLESYGDISDPAKGSKIVIRGELEIIGTQLTASGAGAFVFDDIEQIVLPTNDMVITRNGDRQNEILQVKGVVSFDQVNVTIEECKVMTNGSFEVNNSAEFNIKNADIENGEYNTQFIDEVNIENSEVYNHVLLTFENAEDFQSSDNHYDNGIEIAANFCHKGSFVSDEFENNSVTSFHNIENYVMFESCEMSQFDFDITEIDAAVLPRDGAAITAFRYENEDPFSIILDNTEIKYFEYGVNAGETGLPLGLNVFMRNQATLYDNRVGVYMLGDATSGMVEINCANLIDNEYGIYGTDILLNIDAVLHALSGDGIIRPNKFINDHNKPTSRPFFDICYQRKDIQGEIPASGNYWRIGWYLNNYDPTDQIGIDLNRSPVEVWCLPGEKISLNLDMIEFFEPFGCPPPAINSPTCPQSLAEIGLVDFNSMINNSPDAQILNAFKHEYCLTDDICTSDYSIHGHYWAGHQCVDLNSFESAAEFLDPIAWSQFEDFGMSIYCKQQSLFAAHVINGYNGLPTQGQEIFTITEECVGETKDFFFLLDASGSVDNVEYDLMIESIKNTLKDIGIGINRYAVANFAGGNSFDLIVPFTNDLADTVNIVRTLNGGTEVYDAFVKTKNYILSENSTNQQNIILYTDAISGQFNTPPFDIYNEMKSSPINAEIYVVRYQSGIPGFDDHANEISAAIASKGGTWTGPIASNPADPQGEGTPRKFLAEAFSGSIPILNQGLISCDSITVLIPDDCVDPIIVWTSSDGGQILSDSIDVMTIKTNGVGTYSANVTCKDGCIYVLDDGSPSNGLRIEESQIDFTRYRNGIIVNPHDFENLSSNIDALDISQIGIYPNPVQETLYLNNLPEKMLIELFDLSGRKIASYKNIESNMSIDVSSIADGIYFLNINDLVNGSQESKKIVVSK